MLCSRAPEAFGRAPTGLWPSTKDRKTLRSSFRPSTKYHPGGKYICIYIYSDKTVSGVGANTCLNGLWGIFFGRTLGLRLSFLECRI